MGPGRDHKLSKVQSSVFNPSHEAVPGRDSPILRALVDAALPRRASQSHASGIPPPCPQSLAVSASATIIIKLWLLISEPCHWGSPVTDGNAPGPPPAGPRSTLAQQRASATRCAPVSEFSARLQVGDDLIMIHSKRSAPQNPSPGTQPGRGSG
eukprot:3941538-Rhodomonas_salina.5